MKVLLSGGCKNGKTSLAQKIACNLAGDGPHYYVATMVPYDDEDRERIAHHIEDRENLGFETLECPYYMADAVESKDDRGVFLIDSVTAWLLNSYYPNGFEEEPDMEAEEHCCNQLSRILSFAEHVVFVTDDMYQDGMVYDDFTEHYRRALAHLGCFLAGECDTVLELSTGLIVAHKGRWPL